MGYLEMGQVRIPEILGGRRIGEGVTDSMIRDEQEKCSSFVSLERTWMPRVQRSVLQTSLAYEAMTAARTLYTIG